MLQKLVLIVSLAAQILDELIRALVDFVELVTLDLRHAAASVTSDTSHAVMKLGTELVKLLALRCKAEVVRRLKQLKWLGTS